MNWNRSTLYALAIGILARQIAGGPAVMQPPPSDDEPLSRDTVIDMQQRLGKLNLYTGRGRRPARPQDTLGRAAVSEAGGPAGRRSSDDAGHSEAARDGAVESLLLRQQQSHGSTADSDRDRSVSASSPSICTGWPRRSPASL